MNSPSKILVTGGAGYIGAHTALELIQSGYTPIIIDNFSKSDSTLLEGLEQITKQKPNFIQGNCVDKDFLRKVFKSQSPISCVMHFAAYKSVGESVTKPLDYYYNNIQSLVLLIEVMQEFGVRDLIFSSSCTVYGQPDFIPVNERAPFKRAESPYGATKQMCERILEDTFQTGLRAISLRYFNPIGAHPSALMGELPIGTPNNLIPYVTQTAIGKREKLLAVIDEGCEIGVGTKVWHFSHLMANCKIGEGCNVGQNVVISPKVILGKNVKVQNNVSIYTGVECEDDVFLGPSMVFTNVINPRSAINRKNQYSKTIVKKGATIGANATIVCGHTIGRYAFVGAGAVVTNDVPDYALVVGNPARQTGWISEYGHKLKFNEGGVAVCVESGMEYKLEQGKVNKIE